MAPSKPSPHTKLAIDAIGIAATSTDAKLAAITASLRISLERMEQSRVLLASGVRRLGVKVQKLEAATTSLFAATTTMSATPTDFSVSWRCGTLIDEPSGSIDARLAEIRRLPEGIERRRDSMARQVEVTAQAIARISSVTASTPTSTTVTHHASRPATPAHRPPMTFTGEVVPVRVAGRMAEPFPGDLVVDCIGGGVELMETEESCSPAEFNGPERPPGAALATPLLLTDIIVAPEDTKLAMQLGAGKVFEETPLNTDTTVVAIEKPFQAVVREEDCNCEGTLVQKESDDVLIHVGGSSLFLESVMDITQSLIAAQSPDGNFCAVAEDNLKQSQAQNLTNLLLSLSVELSSNKRPSESRSIAGIILKNSFVAKDSTRKEIPIHHWPLHDVDLGAISVCCSISGFLGHTIKQRTTASMCTSQRFHSSWDPGGSWFACLVLNCKLLATGYYMHNLLGDSVVWEDNKSVFLVIELRVQWDSLLMDSMIWLGGHELVAELGGVWEITNNGATHPSGAVQLPLCLKLEMHATLNHEQNTSVSSLLVEIPELLLLLQGYKLITSMNQLAAPWDPGIVAVKSAVPVRAKPSRVDLNADVGATNYRDLSTPLLGDKQCFAGAVV